MGQKVTKAFPFIVVVGICICILFPIIKLAMPSPRQASSNQFTQLWVVPKVSIPLVTIGERSMVDGFLSVQSDGILLWGNHGRKRGNSLVKIDLMTGAILWTITPEDMAPYILVANQNTVFLGANYGNDPSCEPETRPSCAAITVAAYDTKIGEKNWSRHYTGLPDISQMTIDNSSLIVKGTGGHCSYETTFVINPVTGIEEQPIAYQSCTAQNIENLPSGAPYGLPSGAGMTIQDAASNFTLSNGIVYFLTTDAKLWAFDKKSKGTLGIVEFYPNNFLDSASNNFQVGAIDDIVIVYLGDSQQLFAFRLSPPGK